MFFNEQIKNFFEITNQFIDRYLWNEEINRFVITVLDVKVMCESKIF